MEPIADAVGTALVSAMTTEAWQQARAAAVALWRRVYPGRAETVKAELSETRDEILLAREAGDSKTEEELAADWQRRVHRLLKADPNLTTELRRVLDEELAPLLPADEQSRVGAIVMNATASEHGRVYQAGRDVHIRKP
jgi:hypothetical protein